MRYIRFLKPPRIVDEGNTSKAHIHCLITITSDLGDSFLPYDTILSAELCTVDPIPNGKVLVWKTIQWTSRMRSLAITLPLSRSRPVWPLRVRVGVEPKTTKDVFVKLYDAESRGIVSAWSAPLDPTKGVKDAAKLVSRIIGTDGDEPVCIWEETGESIARHLWDAGVTLSCRLSTLLEAPDSNMIISRSPALAQVKDRCRILELGTGCGVVGIALAQTVPNTEVILTDLPEAKEIANWNIEVAKIAKNSTLKFQELDWDHEVIRDLNDLDMIVAADCTYNPDSSPALVKTLLRLSKASPGVTVIIAMKKRHCSEEVFFDLMSDAGFGLNRRTTIPLPGDVEPGEEEVHVYFFRLKG